MGEVIFLSPQKAKLPPLSPVIADYYERRKELHENAPEYVDTLYLVGACLCERMYQLPQGCLARVFIEHELRKIANLLAPYRLGWH